MWIEPVDEMRKTVNRNLLIALAIAVFVVIPGLSTAFRYRCARRLDTQATQAIDALRAAGYVVSFQGMHHGGWPFAMTLRYDSPRISGPTPFPSPIDGGRAGQIVWAAGQLRLRISLLHPAMLMIHAGRRQILTYTRHDAAHGDTNGALSQPLVFWVQAGPVAVHLRGLGTSELLARFASDSLSFGWSQAGQPVATSIQTVSGNLLWRPHAKPDTTIAALEAHAALLTSDALPTWLRPWPWTAAAAQVALIAPRSGERTARLLVQSMGADIGGAHARFSGAFAASLDEVATMNDATGGATGAGTLVVDGAYAMLDRWLDWAALHPNETTIQIHVAPTTLAAIRHLLPTSHSGPDQISLPIAVQNGRFDIPGSPWARDIARRLAAPPDATEPAAP